MSKPEISDEKAASSEVLKEFGLERYRYILQQLNILNDNVYKFLGIYQALTTAIAGAALALFVGYKNLDIPPPLARSGILGLLFLETVVAFFAILVMVIVILSWLDYRREEVELTDRIVHSGFRKAPTFRNFWRWHEVYIIIFILVSTLSLWICASTLILPGII